jgi:CelD/BcsL family acetyltransferase involved in cellulose biosynthesis
LGSQKYVAFLPLIEDNIKIIGINSVRRMTMGGQPFGVYTGILCTPGLADAVFPLLARYIQGNLKWDTIQMRWVLDMKLDTFLSHFISSNYFTQIKESLTSLYIKLPPDFETYLMKYLSRNSRYTYKKEVSKIENSPEFKITITKSDSTEKEINAMIELWKKRWNQEREARWYRDMLNHYLKNDLLWLFVMWQGEKPVAALSCLPDPAKSTVNAYITSYDPEFSFLSPGIVIFMRAIEFSINNSFRIFDLTVGLDRYKLSFGPKRQKTFNVLIQNKTFRSRMITNFARVAKKLLKLKR